MGEAAEVSSEATVFDTEDTAAAVFKAFGEGLESQALDECLQRFMRENTEAGAEIEVGPVAAKS